MGGFIWMVGFVGWILGMMFRDICIATIGILVMVAGIIMMIVQINLAVAPPTY